MRPGEVVLAGGSIAGCSVIALTGGIDCWLFGDCADLRDRWLTVR